MHHDTLNFSFLLIIINFIVRGFVQSMSSIGRRWFIWAQFLWSSCLLTRYEPVIGIGQSLCGRMQIFTDHALLMSKHISYLIDFQRFFWLRKIILVKKSLLILHWCTLMIRISAYFAHFGRECIFDIWIYLTRWTK